MVIDGRGSSDLDGDPLTFAWTLALRPPGSAAALLTATGPQTSFVPDLAGAYEVVLVVSDGTASSAPSRVLVTAGTVSPVASAGLDRTASTGRPVVLDGSGSRDPLDRPLTYAWTVVSGPPGSAPGLTGAATGQPSFTGDLAGTYEILLTVSVAGGASAGDLVRVVVSRPPQFPAATGGSVTADGGNVTVTIPAGALRVDADVSVTEVASPPAAGANQTAAGKAYEIRLDPATATLSQPMTIALKATPAPVHPQLGEIATLSGTTWTRLSANFTRPPQTVLGLSTSTSATYRVTFRTLRKVDPASASAVRGLDVFQYETFGNEDFFSGGLGLATLLNGVSPAAAVGLGVQVDLAKVPAGIVSVMTGTDLAAKDAALADPAITIALVKAGAVVGVVDKSPAASATLTSVGVSCALCHQLVTPTTFTLTAGAAALPIGPLKLDGAPNLEMDAGKILSLTAGASAAGLAPTLAGWGPGKFDVRNPATINAALDDGANNPTMTPPLWNFVDLEAAGYGFGWDALFFGPDALASQAEAVYHIVMHGKGAFGTAAGAIPPALKIPVGSLPSRILTALPGAASASPTITAATLREVQDWMRSITSPAPGAFDAALAERGWKTFHTRGCTGCHETPEFSGTTTVYPLGAFGGDLAAGIRPPSLRGLTTSGPPYTHDGRAPSLTAIVTGMGGQVGSLTPAEVAEVVEYLKSL